MRIRATHFIVPLYAVLTILYTWPMALHTGTAIPRSDSMLDGPLQAFFIGWDAQALAHAPGRVFSPPIFYPEPNTLTYMDHLIGETVVASPWLALFPSVAPGYNFLVLLSFVASAWAVYRLARLFAVSRSAALLAGFLYAFSLYRFANIDSLNQLQTEFMPLALFFGFRFLRQARTRDFLGMAATFLVQVYFGWYYTFFLAFALLLLFAYGLVRHRAVLARARWGACAALALAVLGLALPVALPYWREARLLPEFHRSLGEVEQYSASGLDYFRVNPRSVLAPWTPFVVSGQAYWPGLVTMLLAAIGLVAWLRKAFPDSWRDAVYLLVLLLLAYVFSLGPYLHVNGHRVLALPYGWVYRVVPALSSIRAVCRLAILVILGLALWAALGYEILRRRTPARKAWILPAIAFPAAAVMAWQLPTDSYELPTAQKIPPVYVWLARQPGAPPVLEVPGPVEVANEKEPEILRQLYVLYHGKPLLGGVSGFVSIRYRNFREALHGFPSDESVDEATRLGAQLVIVHLGEYEAERREALLERMRADARFQPVAEFGLDRVYRLAGTSPGG